MNETKENASKQRIANARHIFIRQVNPLKPGE
jgi:hypothetical protein